MNRGRKIALSEEQIQRAEKAKEKILADMISEQEQRLSPTQFKTAQTGILLLVLWEPKSDLHPFAAVFPEVFLYFVRSFIRLFSQIFGIINFIRMMVGGYAFIPHAAFIKIWRIIIIALRWPYYSAKWTM